uniref:MCMDC2 N-terminal domain-containing protein n=1 Tax=Graphocephala atropunctata TaxID=36148 RepID=A0A1B6LLB1_9HEMI
MDCTDNIEILEGIIKYLDLTGQFEELSVSIQDYKEKFNSDQENLSPMLFNCIKVDFPLLIDIAGDVAKFLLMEPDVAQQLFQHIMNMALNTEDPELNQMIDQIQSTLLVSLPPIPSIVYFTGQSGLPIRGLFVIKGIVMARTVVSKYW